jgi:CDP-diacylglycerol---serine O-phosphatidyltransferase
MRLRKALFVLPNLFTASSIFCGFYAITLCAAGDARPDRYYQAAIAILFAMFFDGADGRVARLTKTQSEFGMQLDSLADVISFGVAPALLLYKWALQPLGFWGLFLSFAFSACGAMRLARFNILANRHPAAMSFFVGLPIPLAAGMVIALVIVNGHNAQSIPVWPIAAVGLGLSYLMVSNIRYRTFKETHLSRRKGAILIALAAIVVVAGLLVQPAIALFAAIAGYILLGLAEGGVRIGQRRLERRRARRLERALMASDAADGDGDGDEDDDDEASDVERFA